MTRSRPERKHEPAPAEPVVDGDRRAERSGPYSSASGSATVTYARVPVPSRVGR